MYRQQRPALNWFRFTLGNRRSVAKRTRANDQRLKTYRPRFDTLEERLPPGDSVLGALLAGWWAGPVSGPLIAQAERLPAPEGRPSVARGVSPCEAVEQSFGEPRRGDRSIARSELLSLFQGSDGQQLVDSQGWRPGLTTFARSAG